MSLFKGNGTITLQLPLAPGYERLVQDFLRIVLTKSGFAEESSNLHAAQYSEFLQKKVAPLEEDLPVEIRFNHHPGKVIIHTRIEGLHVSDTQDGKIN
ncbi:MAG: hypothetical protein U0V70_22360 [Terriglobia bacterium]